jgi:3-methyl-2-oxobutanoate hydroxymethyltransferase
MAADPASARRTAGAITRMKARGEKIVVLTAYDAPSATLVDRAGVDVILVGDSLGLVVLGHGSTLPVTLDDMVRHTAAVTRACPRALVVGDMPFLTFHTTPEDAVRAAGRLVQEGGADAVKLEGGSRVRAEIEAILRAQIPVMGHLGLTPQSILRLGGYRVQGRTADAADELVRDAALLERLGCFAIVLEGIPRGLAGRVTESVAIPTIGIGAGPRCDGQVLVFHDVFGIHEGIRPRFVRRYAEVGAVIEEAARAFAADVREGRFPNPEESYEE